MDYQPRPVSTDMTVKLLTSRSSSNLIRLVPVVKKTMLPPHISRAKKVMEMIKKMKVWNKELMINMKTGGPFIDKSTQMLKAFRLSLKKEDVDIIKKEIDEDGERYDETKLKEFQKGVIDTYFNLTDFSKNQFVTDEPNYMLWSMKSWEEFKERVFNKFTSTNFISCNLTFTWKQNDNRGLTKIDTIQLEKDHYLFVQIKDLMYCCADKPSTATWKWDNVKEYKRLKIAGKAIYQTKLKSEGKNYYWIPLLLDDALQKIRTVNYSKAESKFLITEQEITDIIALAPFDRVTNTIVINDIVTEGVFDASYLHEIIKVIDKTLNAVMKEVMAKYSLTDFCDFEKKF